MLEKEINIYLEGRIFIRLRQSLAYLNPGRILKFYGSVAHLSRIIENDEVDVHYNICYSCHADIEKGSHSHFHLCVGATKVGR